MNEMRNQRGALGQLSAAQGERSTPDLGDTQAGTHRWACHMSARLALVLAIGACGHRPADKPISYAAVAAMRAPAADARIAYGAGALQFGNLRLPNGAGPFAVVVFIHGGCWQSDFTLDHVAPAAAALTRSGVATWTIEYRRIGDTGGGWPGTFEDVARAIAHLEQLAATYPLDLQRVVLVGHSAGGQLALWAADRQRTTVGQAPPVPASIRIRGVVSLAGIGDLRAYGAAPGGCNQSVRELLGGSAAERPERYAAASPADRLPLGVPLRLIHGSADPIVPVDESRSFASRARAAGDDARVEIIPRAGHFDLIAPTSPAWPAVVRAVGELASAH